MCVYCESTKYLVQETAILDEKKKHAKTWTHTYSFVSRYPWKKKNTRQVRQTYKPTVFQTCFLQVLFRENKWTRKKVKQWILAYVDYCFLFPSLVSWWFQFSYVKCLCVCKINTLLEHIDLIKTILWRNTITTQVVYHCKTDEIYRYIKTIMLDIFGIA